MRVAGRRSRLLVGVLAALLIATTGCTREVAGSARPDPRTPGVAVTGDGNGVIAGFDDAPVQLEIFTEPQCARCIRLQREHGDQFTTFIGWGQLAITYRPLTYLDSRSGGESNQATNALFLAAVPGADATALQRFVGDLFGRRDLLGPGPDDDEIAAMAERSGLPEDAVDAIASGEQAVDADAVGEENFDLLLDTATGSPATPVVYDLGTGTVVNIGSEDWLERLVEEG